MTPRETSAIIDRYREDLEAHLGVFGGEKKKDPGSSLDKFRSLAARNPKQKGK